MPLQLRLAALFAAFVAIAMFGTVFGVRQSFHIATRTRLEQDLAHEAQLLSETNRVASNPNQRDDVEYLPYVVPPAVVHLTRVQWFDPACQRFSYFSDQVSNYIKQGELLPLSDDGLAVIHNGHPWSQEINLPTAGGMNLIYSQPIMNGNRVTGLAQVAQSLEVPYQNLTELWRGLFLGGIVLTFGSFGAAWWVAGVCLRPLRRVANAADSIRISHDFSRRLIGPSTVNQIEGRHQDEVGQLVSSVDAMLGEMRDMQQTTTHALDHQRQFLADVSHELRTPLTTIYGNLRLLERNLEDADRDAVLRDAVDETERMSRLLHKLLLMARGENTHALNCCPLSLATLLEDTLHKVSVLNQDHHVVTRILAHPIVQADADAIRQIVLILIDNALKFTPPDGQITVTLRQDNQYAQISVLDTGVGMDSEQVQHIFERFYRARDTQHTRGTGLGLAIAKEIVTAHGGSISVASQRGYGSEFTVSLPHSDAGFKNAAA